MRILLVSAAYPPERCGVGDYSRRLAHQLAARRGIEVAVLVAARDAVQEPAGPQLLYAENGSVRFTDLRRAVGRFRPDLVHLQHPTMRVIHPLVACLARTVLGLPVAETWHEHMKTWHWTDWLRVPSLSGLVHVRPDLPEHLHPRIRSLLRGTPVQFIEGERTIPTVVLPESERGPARRRIAGNAALVTFFGFIYPNKGTHLMFEIADPVRHHVLIVGELDPANDYQRRIAELAQSPRWQGRATTAGFVEAQEAARLLAISDAVIFPFPGGTGQWNSSMNAALAAGALVIGTTADAGRIGYDAERNLCLTAPDDVAAMRAALDGHLGARRRPETADGWERIAASHERFYEQLL